jgi:hypothetical protein
MRYFLPEGSVVLYTLTIFAGKNRHFSGEVAGRVENSTCLLRTHKITLNSLLTAFFIEINAAGSNKIQGKRAKIFTPVPQNR